jgi:hypothetical protein
LLQNGDVNVYQFLNGEFTFHQRLPESHIQSLGGNSLCRVYEVIQQEKRNTVQTLLSQSQYALTNKDFDTAGKHIQRIHHLGYPITAQRLQLEKAKAKEDSLATLKYAWELYRSLPPSHQEFQQCAIELLYCLSQFHLTVRFQEVVAALQLQQPDYIQWLMEHHPILHAFTNLERKYPIWIDTEISLSSWLQAVDIVQSGLNACVVYKKMQEFIDPEGLTQLDDIAYHSQTNPRYPFTEAPAKFHLQTVNWLAAGTSEIRTVLILDSDEHKSWQEVGYGVWSMRTGGKTRFYPLIYIELQGKQTGEFHQNLDTVLHDPALPLWAASINNQLITKLRSLITMGLSKRKEII